MAATPASVQVHGRLAGKIAVVTGAAGNLGGNIVRHYLREGATVVMTGRSASRIESAADSLRSETGADAARLATVVLDGADSQSVRSGIADVIKRFGRIDILVNNAGSAGPKQPLERLPLNAEELAALLQDGATDSETVGDAVRNIFGVAWNLVRAAGPALNEGASIINVSTIFSRTPYYARTAYVVPKAAMNAWSHELSLQLGPRGIRVNLVLPGPIESERIRTVFAAMDKMRGDDVGTTALLFLDTMSLERSVDGAAKAKTFPTPDDIAATCVFLGSDESAAFNGHDFEVTHGMNVPKEAGSTYLSHPKVRSTDGAGLAVLIVAGDGWEEALEIAKAQLAAGARVLFGLSPQADLVTAQALVRTENAGEGLTIIHFDRTDPAAMEAALEAYTLRGTPITGAIFLPFHAPGELAAPLTEASDDVVEAFVVVELCGAIALARTLSRYWKLHGGLLQHPRFVFLSNATDGKGDVYANMLRAATEQLVRIWRDESKIDVIQGRRRQTEWGNQIVRFSNNESANLRFAAGHAASILLTQSKIREVTLYLPQYIGEVTCACVASNAKSA